MAAMLVAGMTKNLPFQGGFFVYFEDAEKMFFLPLELSHDDSDGFAVPRFGKCPEVRCCVYFYFFVIRFYIEGYAPLLISNFCLIFFQYFFRVWQ
ncbi:MAG: hypothetical protein WCF77_02595 [Minisyncoccia bacterium]